MAQCPTVIAPYTTCPIGEIEIDNKLTKIIYDGQLRFLGS
jgi:hypothetical protein